MPNYHPQNHYAELFCQSNFSFLVGASHPEELVLQASFLNYHALAITDECSVAGIVRAYSEIKKLGLSLKLIAGSVFSFQDSFRFVLLCPNRHAWSELCRIITNSRRRSVKGEYQLEEWDLLSIEHCLLIWLPQGTYSGSAGTDDCEQSDKYWGKWLKRYQKLRIKKWRNKLNTKRDKERPKTASELDDNNFIYLGVQRHLHSNEQQYLNHCQQLAQKLSLPITACGGVLMHAPERLPLHHSITAIRLGTTVATTGRELLSNSEYSLRSLGKIAKLFQTSWLDESIKIAQKCHFELCELRYQYPKELVPEGKTAMEHLRELVAKGIKIRFPDGIDQDIKTTIDKELTLIEELDYPYFFLTIHDIVMFAKAQNILYQGRGSAANSVVCYCLEITAVDPRQISVLFERFISKERNEPPDIDVDFEHHRREEVIQYIYQKYGRERAALAATVITYRLKMAIREIGKVLGLQVAQLDYFIKNINRRDRGLHWQNQIVELGLNPSSQQGQHFIQLVNELIGFPRHLSQHVGGFVISQGPLYELVPVENAAMAERTVIQWDKDDLESLGLLKVDVLALGMLSAIRRTLDLLKQHHQTRLSLADITRLQDDENVYQMIQQADTIGVFQIESRAQMSMLPRLKPATYYDLVIQIAIVRPGPIQGDMVHPFLLRRDGKEAITYPSEEVKSVLSRTLGVPIFQEQVIKLAMVAAGFSGGEADQLRRAMAKWKRNGELMQFKEKLLSGMAKRGYEASFAERIFEQICGFGEYGFPESHSASFAILAYVSAWLKHYYPEAFYTALLNSLPMGFYSASQLVQDAKRHHVVILPVCINRSDYEHKLVKQDSDQMAIQLGFKLVKGLAKQNVDKLITQRPSQGFSNIEQIKSLDIPKRDIQQLASANALKAISGNRFATRWALADSEYELPLFAQSAQVSEEIKEPEQGYLFAPSDLDTLNEDYASTGLCLSHHPISLLDNAGKLGRFARMTELSALRNNQMVTVIGVVTGKQSPGTAGGVTFITLEDDTGNINVVVWAGTARAQKSPYMSAKILKVKGVLERSGKVTHIIAGKLIDLTDHLADLKTSSRDFH